MIIQLIHLTFYQGTIEMLRMIRPLYTNKTQIAAFLILLSSSSTLYAVVGPATDSSEVTKKTVYPDRTLHGYVLYTSPIISIANQKHGYPSVLTRVPYSCDDGYGACVETIIYATNSTDESGGSQGGCTFRELHAYGDITQTASGYDVHSTIGIYTPDRCYNRGGKAIFVVNCIPAGNIDAAAVSSRYCTYGVSS